MLRIRRLGDEAEVVLALSGRMGEEEIFQLEMLIRAEASASRIVLDLRNLTLVGRNAISFLERCEADSVELRNCPAYVREWITRSRDGNQAKE
jgi:hypothetical protein